MKSRSEEHKIWAAELRLAEERADKMREEVAYLRHVKQEDSGRIKFLEK
jgi:hypothetical protein